jgi:hypothetical protein
MHVTRIRRSSLEIQTGVVIGRMSKRALRMVLEWSDQHQEELLRIGASPVGGSL